MGLTLVTPATAELFPLDYVKAHLRQDIDDDDELIAGYIAAARAHLEEICGRSFLSTTWDFTIDYEWPWILDVDQGRHVRMIELPRAPLASVTSISYVDGAGATQTLAGSQYTVDGGGAIGRIYEAYNATWPTVRSQPRAITVRFVAGYGADAVSVPETIKQATLLLTTHFYQQREPVVVGTSVLKLPFAVDALIDPHRVHW
jgi:uncharacterized phiE125 gp8 family phage protein